MNSILTKLLIFLSTNYSPLADNLIPGLQRQSVREKLMDVIKTAPEDLVELYNWQNGTPFPDSSKAFFDHVFHMYNIEFAIEHYKAFQKLEPDMNFGVSFENLFPIFLSGGGEYYFYCFSGSDKGRVYYNSPAEFLGETVLAFVTLEQMFISIYECYKREVYYLDANGNMKVKTQEHLELMKSLNPECQKWNGKEVESELIIIELPKQ